MSAIATRCVILFVCAVLATAQAGAAGRNSDARESAGKKAAPTSKENSDNWQQDLETWLARLNGSFSVKLEPLPEIKCTTPNYSAPNSTQTCTISKQRNYVSTVNCRRIGQGPGLYCTFDQLRMEPTGKQGGEAGAPMSLFSNDLPSRMLLGIDPVARKISMMAMGANGSGYSEKASPAGNEVTFKGRCDTAESTARVGPCNWSLWMRATPDGRKILLTHTRTYTTGLGTSRAESPDTFELRRIAQ